MATGRGMARGVSEGWYSGFLNARGKGITSVCGCNEDPVFWIV